HGDYSLGSCGRRSCEGGSRSCLSSSLHLVLLVLQSPCHCSTLWLYPGSAEKALPGAVSVRTTFCKGCLRTVQTKEWRTRWDSNSRRLALFEPKYPLAGYT